MQQRLNGLKSRSDESRLQAAKDLQHYVSTELREASAEQYTSFMDSTVFHSNFRHRIEAIKVVESKAKPNCFSTSFSR